MAGHDVKQAAESVELQEKERPAKMTPNLQLPEEHFGFA
jgi:hypothetical protein